MNRPHLAKLAACALLAALGAEPGAAQELFPGALYPTACPTNPQYNTPFWGGVLADFDQDGDPDLAASCAAAALGVCMTAGGAPGPVTCHPAPNALSRMAAADLDLDGDLDVVAIGFGTGVFSFLNAGSGTFPIYSVAVGPTGNAAELTVGRVGPDPFPDAVAVHPVGTNFAVKFLNGTGLGTLANYVAGPTFTSPIHLVQDDDADGDLDLHEVVGGSLVTLRNNGGAFAAPVVRCSFLPFAPAGGRIAFADVDVDGNLDAVLVASVAAPGVAFVQVALGNGAGILTPGPAQPLGVTSPFSWISLADFDGDGDPDLLAASPSNGAFYSSGLSGVFSPGVFVTHATIGSIATGDVDADGRADALFFTTTGYAAVARGRASTGLVHSTSIPVLQNGVDFLIDDLDADGSADAIVSYYQINTGGPPTSGVATYLNVNAGPALSQNVVTGAAAQIADLATCDWNRDGAVDVIALDALNTVKILLGTPSGALQPPTTIPLGIFSWNKVIPADVNQDGIADLLVSDASNVHVWLGDGLGGVSSVVSTPVCPNPPITSCLLPPFIEAADVNQDGLLDVVALFGSYASPTGARIHLGNGDGTFTYTSTTTCCAGAYPTSLLLRDMNGDAVVDMVLSVPSGSGGPGTVRVLPGLGAGVFGAPLTTTVPSPSATGTSFMGAYPNPAAGDVNGDGFPDVVFPGGAILLNDGSGGLVMHELLSVFPSTRVAIADLNFDLQQDLAFFEPTIAAGWLTLVRNTTPCSANGYRYGLGCPGAGSFVPSLGAFGCASPGGVLTLRIEHALGGPQSAVLFVGPGPANAPVGFGCSILVQLTGSFLAPFPLGGLPGPGLGSGDLTVVVPPGIPPGTSVAVQAAIPDPSSPFQWSATNGFALLIQ